MKEKTFESLRLNVLGWAEQRDLLHADNSLAQMGKVLEEIEEFYDEMKAGDTPKMKMEFGDVLVSLIVLANQQGLDEVDCLSMAYEKIKNRKGKTVNGTFVREKDEVSEYKFKKGDRFVVAKPTEHDTFRGIRKGDAGEFLEDNNSFPWVRMDKFNEELGDADGLCEWGHGLVLHEHQLELEEK